MIPKLPHPWGSDDYPYEALCGSGVTVNSSHDEILAVSLRLQAEGAWSTAILRAWDELRKVETRLAVDFFLYDPALSQPEKIVEQEIEKFLAAVDKNASG